MGCSQSNAAATNAKPFKDVPEGSKANQSRAKPGTLTSSVYNDSNPPLDWRDTSFLVPHEWLRREMNALVTSTEALVPDDKEGWKAEYLAKWILQVLLVVFKYHHTNEDDIYMPMLIENGCKISEKKISDDHHSLIEQLAEIGELADTIEKAEGLNCSTAISTLKTKIPVFVEKMKVHLMEEEIEIPKALKEKNLDKNHHDEAINKIIQAAGLEGLKTEIPAVIVATQEWATDAEYQDLLKEIPPPILKLQQDIFIPNYHTYYCALRDAPTMSEKPPLTQIPFDPSMLPPPPPAE